MMAIFTKLDSESQVARVVQWSAHQASVRTGFVPRDLRAYIWWFRLPFRFAFHPPSLCDPEALDSSPSLSIIAFLFCQMLFRSAKISLK